MHLHRNYFTKLRIIITRYFREGNLYRFLISLTYGSADRLASYYLALLAESEVMLYVRDCSFLVSALLRQRWVLMNVVSGLVKAVHGVKNHQSVAIIARSSACHQQFVNAVC